MLTREAGQVPDPAVQVARMSDHHEQGRGACSPSAAATRAADEPQAPSTLAPWPFFSAATSAETLRCLDDPGQIVEAIQSWEKRRRRRHTSFLLPYFSIEEPGREHRCAR